MVTDFKKQLFYFIIASSIIYFITAFNGHGFYQADEHYQIVEFAQYHLGINTPNDLPWEFKNQIRPTLQPLMCAGIFKTLRTLGINNPYTLNTILRFLSAILSIFTITLFVKKTENKFPENKWIYYFLSFFLWFAPSIHVRFNSENWSAMFFLISLAVFNSKDQTAKKPLLMGLLLGFSFLFRFQIAFAGLGLILWLIFIEKVNWKFHLRLFGSAFLIFGIFGIAIDSWFYGNFVITQWNYVYENIVEGVAASFGTSPWYYYFYEIISFPSYIMGSLIVLSILFLLFKQPKNLYLWCLIPFVVIHSFSSHKEERYIFPMICLLPIILTQVLQATKPKVQSRKFLFNASKGILIILLILNISGALIMSQKSAGIGRGTITKHIHDNYGNQPIHLIYCSWANPYNPWHSLPTKFYEEKDILETRIEQVDQLNKNLIKQDRINLLVIRKANLTNPNSSKFILQKRFYKETQSIPSLTASINSFGSWVNSDNILELYKYDESKF